MSQLPKTIKLTKTEVSQRFNLSDIFGKNYSPDARTRQEIGQWIIDRIRDRTADGKDIFYNDFKAPYSDSYVESEEFKDAGKSRNDVNMELTGAMLESITSTDLVDSIVVSIPSDESPKAYGHMTDFEGHPTLGGKGNRRQFFGLGSRDIDDLKKEFGQQETASEIDFFTVEFAQRRSAQQIFNDIFGGVFGNESQN